MTRVRAYTVAEVGRALGMTSVEVHKAIERSLLRAFTINKAIRVPATKSSACRQTWPAAIVTKSQVNVTRPKAGADDRK